MQTTTEAQQKDIASEMAELLQEYLSPVPPEHCRSSLEWKIDFHCRVKNVLDRFGEQRS